jgi:two-component system, OmpR family, sensor kinase
MFRTLYAKLAAVLMGLFCLIGIFHILLTLFTTQLHLQEVSQKFNRTLAEHLVSKNILMTDGRLNAPVLKDIFHMLMVINPSIEIYLLDPNGRILAFSAPPGKVKRRAVSLEPVRRFLSRAPAFPILGDDPRDAGRKKIFSVSPIPASGPVEGYLYVILGGEEYDSMAQMLRGSYILRLSIGAVIGGLLFAMLAGLILFNLMTRRLKRLASAMEVFKQSDFSEPLSASSLPIGRAGDEIDQLGETFQRMMDRIVHQMNKLKETDALRRELVANVSHDLRTPLASLHGYLETLLLKEGSLTPEEHRAYLEIANRHSERLGKLVSELFELAKLDSQETRPRIEPFSLSELVQDVVQKFRLSAENKNIRLRAELRGDLPFVSADIGLIERVLENLIENALRHTPPDGRVTVSLMNGNDRITVQTADTGCGIPSEEIPHIFDRFYRVGQRRTEGSDGAGLGLAIAKRILELHGSEIRAESGVRGGAVFTFSLPVYNP